MLDSAWMSVRRVWWGVSTNITMRETVLGKGRMKVRTLIYSVGDMRVTPGIHHEVTREAMDRLRKSPALREASAIDSEVAERDATQ